MRSPLLYEQRSSVGSCCVSACLFLVTLNSHFLLNPLLKQTLCSLVFTFLMKFKCVYIYNIHVHLFFNTVKLIGAFLASLDYKDGLRIPLFDLCSDFMRVRSCS